MEEYCIVKVADNTMMSKETLSDIPHPASYTYIGLIDRRKSKEHWWTGKPSMLMVFNNKEAAETACSKLKYGKPYVVKKQTAESKITHWHTKDQRSTLGKLLDERELLWHDDDWYEGINDTNN